MRLDAIQVIGERPRCQDVIHHHAPSAVNDRVARVIGNHIVQRNQCTVCEGGIPCILNAGSQGCNRNLLVGRVKVAAHGNQRLSIQIEKPFHNEPSFQCLGITLQTCDEESLGPRSGVRPTEC